MLYQNILIQNLFTATFSKVPKYTYIAITKIDGILENIRYEKPTDIGKENVNEKNVEK